MKRLILVGSGFDLAQSLPKSFSAFAPQKCMTAMKDFLFLRSK